MVFVKFAAAQVLDARIAQKGSGLVRNAHRHEFEYEARPGFLYVRSRAISSRTNDNYDHFPADEIKKSYATFIGKPVFVNHHNDNHRRARGVIVDAALHEDVNPDGSPDTWAEVLMEVDAVRFPKLAQAILAGEIDRTSMGCFVPGTLVTLADGTQKPIETIVLGDEVLTHTGKTEPVTYVMERDYDGVVYDVRTFGQASSLVMTDEHPVWIKRPIEDSIGWVEARDVRPGDWVLSPTHAEVGHPGSYPFAKLLGFYLAEGNFGWDRNRRPDGPVTVEWSFDAGGYKDEIGHVQEVVALLESMGYTAAGPYTKNNSYSIRCNSPELADKFLAYGGQHPWAKKIHPEVMTWAVDNQRAVLEGYLLGDAHFRHGTHAEAGTASQALAQQMQLLAVRCGVNMTPPVRQHSPSAVAAGHRPKYSMQAQMEPALTPVAQTERANQAYIDGSGMWRQVTDIVMKTYQGKVYNFDVEGDDSYVAADVAVHNCDVAFSVCSVCNNKAETPLDYCFLPGTLVTMADGTLRPIETIVAGDEVLTHDGPGTVVAPMERHYNGPMSRIHRRGYSAPLYLTHGHQILANRVGYRDESRSGSERYASVLSAENWGWVESEEVHEGHWVQGAYPTSSETVEVRVADFAPDLTEREGRAVLASPYTSGRHLGQFQYGKNSLPAVLSTDDEHLGFIAGLFAAEGSFETALTAAGTPKTISWSLGAHEEDLVSDLTLALDKLGAGIPKVYPRGGGIQVRLSNAPLAGLLLSWVGSGAHTKHLSGEVMLAPESFQRAFLDAYYRGDGWDDPRGHVEVRTVGGLLARQLVMLGARVETSVPSWWENLHNPGGPTRREGLGTVHHVSMGRSGAMKGRRRLDEGYFANRVVRVETDHYHGPVFNFEVAGQNSYVAEGVVVHNCQHIPKLKGKKIYRTTASGEKEAVLVYEKCYGLGFFENSLLVEEPADPTAHFLGVDARGMQTAARKTASRVEGRGGVAPGQVEDLHYDWGYDDGFLGNLKEYPGDAEYEQGYLYGQQEKARLAEAPVLQAAARYAESTDIEGDAGPVNSVGEVKVGDHLWWRYDAIGAGHFIPVTVTKNDGKTMTFRSDGTGHSVERVSNAQIFPAGQHHTLRKMTPELAHAASKAVSIRATASKTALGETMAPAEVDTLRDESCPVCGEADSFDGEKCQVCNFIKPPDEFLDPDLEKAKQVDLRQDQIAEDAAPAAQDGAADPNQAPGDPLQEGANPGQPWLNATKPAVDPAVDPAAGDPAAGDPASTGGNPWEQKTKPVAPAQTPTGASPAPVDGTSTEPWKARTRRKSARATSQKEHSMRPALAALAEQQKKIDALTGVVSFVVEAAGLTNHPRVASLMKQAADENPAQGVGWAVTSPEAQGSEAPKQTTEQALAPSQGTDDPTNAGAAPGTDVKPGATTSLDSTEVSLPVTLDLNEQDPTKPVAGTNDLGEGARGQAGSGRTETEVRAGNPNKPDVAFAETGWTNTSAKISEPRQIASLRLARLRVQAGIETGDDLTVGTTIAASSVTDEAIQSEIETLAKVVQASGQRPTVTATRHLVPRSASNIQRTTPSFAGEPAQPMQTVASGPHDSEFLFE